MVCNEILNTLIWKQDKDMHLTCLFDTVLDDLARAVR